MRLSELRVFHQLKSSASPISVASTRLGVESAFAIDSCLRRVWVLGEGAEFSFPDVVCHSGTEAYAFLLRLACGLESRIAGETDIFGQLKEAWQLYAGGADSALSEELAPWIQRLFEDAKEVRSLYLRNVGGASYGTLVRKMFQAEEGAGLAPSKTLLIGAGRLAKAVAPFLLEDGGELWIWNRSRARAETLAERCREQNPGVRVLVFSGAAELTRALEQASRAVVCAPFEIAPDGVSDPQAVPGNEDRARVEAWRRGGAERRLIHLGGLRAQSGAWSELAGYRGLDEIFDLGKAQDNLRLVQVTRSRRACDEKAKLRALGGSSATQHGWEDLAVFASG